MNASGIMTEGTPWKEIIRFAFPLILSNILQQLYNTVDTLVIGNMDTQNALAAVGSCNYMIMLYLAVAMGFSMSVSVLVSQSFGAKDEQSMKRFAGGGAVFLLILGAAMTGVAYLTNRLILSHVIGVLPEILPMAEEYMKFYCIGLIFQFGYNVVAGILRAVGDSKSSLYFLLVTSVLNIGLDLLFVGVFKWSVMGVALATTIAQFVSMAVALVYMLKKYPVFRPERGTWKADRRIALQITKLGIPMAVQTMVVSFGFMFLQRLANSFGDPNLVAAYTVACRIEIYMLVPMSAVANAMSTYTGQNYGAGKMDRLPLGAKQAMMINVCMDVVIGALCFIFADTLAGLFGLEEAAIGFASAQIRVVAFDLFLPAMYTPLSGVYQGTGKSRISMTCSMIEMAGRLVFAYALASMIGPGGLWWGEPLAFGSVLVFSFFWFFTGRWKKGLRLGEQTVENV